MSKNVKIFLFLIFTLSGLSSLIYQVVWIRLAFGSFGCITPVMSVAISVFMLGIALGSWLGGKYIDILSEKLKTPSIFFYVVSELFIASGALTVPKLFIFFQHMLLNTGATNSFSYLLLSAVSLALCLLPWCFAMGTTFPFMMSYLKNIYKNQTTSFSFLYTANVVGGMIGVLGTTVVFIEMFGFNGTLSVACIGNLLAILFSFIVYKITFNTKQNFLFSENFISNSTETDVSVEKQNISDRFIFIISFITGFTTLALEIVWTRAYSPVLGTMVYSFAFLLAGYLFATWLGSYLYRTDLNSNKLKSPAFIVSCAAIFVFIPILINDPQLFVYGGTYMLNSENIAKYFFQIVLTIIPFCTVLGYLMPLLVDSYSKGNPYKAGKLYTVNVIGCILGPLAASYILLPYLGVKISLILLALPYTMLLLVLLKQLTTIMKIFPVILSVLFIIISVCYTKTYEIPNFSSEEEVFLKRDYSATVLGVVNKKNKEKQLLVNGYGITSITPITKFMAHLPMMFCEHKPTDALVICFGMGTTYRSLLSWGINVTAVELTPSVVDMFPLFFDDAKEILNNKKGKIIVDDGRRFLLRTKEKFDVITLDPPPPIQSSGSSMLYSKEFCHLAKTRLKKGGILQHWVPISLGFQNYSDFFSLPVLRALQSEFKYVVAFTSISRWGIHFLASDEPIKILTAKEFVNKMPDTAKKDLMEWNKNIDIVDFISMLGYIDNRFFDKINPNKDFIVTDDRPYNEYFFLSEQEFKKNRRN